MLTLCQAVRSRSTQRFQLLNALPSELHPEIELNNTRSASGGELSEITVGYLSLETA